MSTWFKQLLGACICSVILGCGGSSDPVAPPDDGGGTPPAVLTPPVSPSSVSVEPGDTVNIVQWSAVATATSYDLYWSETTPVDVATANVITSAVSPYTHTGLTNGKLIYYAVVAVNADGRSAPSGEMGAMPMGLRPASPGTVHATPGNGTVTVDWVPVARAISYNLYWANSPNPVPGAAGVTKIENITGTSYLHAGLTNGSTYYYVVTATGSGGESVGAASASAMPLPPQPGAPTHLTVTSEDTHVHLAWSPTLDATSYNIYWAKAAGVVPGGAGVTKISGVTETSYTHEGLTNGVKYDYVVSAVGPGGESAISAEVSAEPLPPAPPAPRGLTGIAPKDTTPITVQWFDITDYPSADASIQLGYNLYRGLEPGLATYYSDLSRATKIANVTAPFIDASVVGSTTYYYVVTSFVPSLPKVESAPSGEVSATTSKAGGGGGGDDGGDEGFGSNLSFPVVFADSYGITGAKISGTWQGLGPFTPAPAFDFNAGVRPLSTETLTTFPYLDSSTAVSVSGVTYYPQASASTWQAEWRNNAQGAPLEVIVDWGDALLSKTYTASSLVRIETVLSQDASIAGIADTMKAYTMKLLSGSQTTELQGTDGTTYDSAARNVFAINARLKIEKIATDGGADVEVYNQTIYESFGVAEEGGETTGGPTTYGVEVNAAGILVYGHNLKLSALTIPVKTGQYRITFSLDPQATVGTEKVQNHIKMVSKKDAGATLSADGLSSSVIITVN